MRDSSRSSRTRGNTTVAVIAAVGCFALVVGVLLYARSEKAPAEKETAATPQPVVQPTPVLRVKHLPQAATAVVESQPVAAAPVDAVDPLSGRLHNVQGHLSAGEFAQAVDVALTGADDAERSRLLKLVAEAQLAAGEFDAALATIRRIPDAKVRQAALGERANEVAQAAGGQGVDFQTLIDLIQQETSGPWQDVEGEGGTISQYPTGVKVDPNGLLRHLTRQERSEQLKALGVKARKADLNEDMARVSNLRLVSLTRLEKDLARRLAEGKSVPASMKYFAGITKVQYVFVYPETGEIVIGGPAEGWRYNDSGLAVGEISGMPTLQLDDFVTVFRTFNDGSRKFLCMINPRQEGMQKAQQYASESSARGPLRPAAVKNFAARLQELLGLQDVVVEGVPADSRVARVIVEADYRMKLIGVDRLQSAANIPSYFDLLAKTGRIPKSSGGALRWWLTMKYEGVLHSKAKDVFQIQGSSVQCKSENEVITRDGQRKHTGQSEVTNKLFADTFTAKYAELAKHDIAFADLQNIMDLSLVAALIRHEGLDRKAGFDGGEFAGDGRYQTQRYEPARTVDSVVNHRVYKGRDIVVQIAGGVRGDLMAVVKDQTLRRELPRLSGMAKQARAPKLPAGRWWWDAK